MSINTQSTVLTLPHWGGTSALCMHVKTSSRSDDITTKPLMPFSSSTRDFLMVSRRTLYRWICVCVCVVRDKCSYKYYPKWCYLNRCIYCCEVCERSVYTGQVLSSAAIISSLTIYHTIYQDIHNQFRPVHTQEALLQYPHAYTLMQHEMWDWLIGRYTLVAYPSYAVQ